MLTSAFAATSSFRPLACPLKAALWAGVSRRTVCQPNMTKTNNKQHQHASTHPRIDIGFEIDECLDEPQHALLAVRSMDRSSEGVVQHGVLFRIKDEFVQLVLSSQLSEIGQLNLRRPAIEQGEAQTEQQGLGSQQHCQRLQLSSARIHRKTACSSGHAGFRCVPKKLHHRGGNESGQHPGRQRRACAETRPCRAQANTGAC